MGRVFGILFIVAAIWIGVELYSEGRDGAFGGLLAGGTPAPEVPAATPGERAGERLRSTYREQVDRVDRQLGRGPGAGAGRD